MTIWKDEKQLLAEQLQRAYSRPPTSDERFKRLLDQIERARSERRIRDAA